MLLAVVAEDTPLPALTDEQIAQVKISLEEAAVGHFAADDEVTAVYEKYRARRGKNSRRTCGMPTG